MTLPYLSPGQGARTKREGGEKKENYTIIKGKKKICVEIQIRAVKSMRFLITNNE